MHRQAVILLLTTVFVMGCAASSPPPQSQPSQELAQASATLDRMLDCPPPPPADLLCLAGDAPRLVTATDGSTEYRCQPPSSLLAAIDSDPLDLAKVSAEAIGAWRKEVDLRFKGQAATASCRASTGAANMPVPKP